MTVNINNIAAPSSIVVDATSAISAEGTAHSHLSGTVDPVQVALAIKQIKASTQNMMQDFRAGSLYSSFSGLA